MGIEYKHGDPQAQLATASRIGERKRQDAQRIREEGRSYQESQKQQDFEIDMYMAQRAKLWEIEKMEMRSRTDFEHEERSRQKKLAEKDAKLDALESAYKNGQINEDDYQQAVLQTQSEIPFYIQSQISKRVGAESTPSPTRQLGDINAQYELQGFTSADLEEVGLDPNDFPSVPRTEDVINPNVQPTSVQTGSGKFVIVQDSDGNIIKLPNNPETIQQAIQLGAIILSDTVDKSKPKHSPAGTQFLEEEEVEKKKHRFDYLRDRFDKSNDPVASYIKKRYP